MSRTTIMIAGAAVGILLIALAAATLASAYDGFRNGRSDWMLGWGLVGMLLMGAGGSAIVGTWIHQYRIRRRG